MEQVNWKEEYKQYYGEYFEHELFEFVCSCGNNTFILAQAPYITFGKCTKCGIFRLISEG